MDDNELEAASEKIVALGLTRYEDRRWCRSYASEKCFHGIELLYSSGRPWHVYGYGGGRYFKYLDAALAALETQS
jgi:hypothetical protein